MAPPSCKRCRVHEASEDLEHLISWASAANLRAGWELYSKLRVYGLSPSASALEMHPKCSSPVLPHFDTASTIVKESILKTLQRRRVSRAKRGEDIPPEEAEVPPLRAVSNWSSLPVDVALQVGLIPPKGNHLPAPTPSRLCCSKFSASLLCSSAPPPFVTQIVTHLESQHLHKAACISTMYKDVIGCVISSLSFCCYDHSNKEVTPPALLWRSPSGAVLPPSWAPLHQ